MGIISKDFTFSSGATIIASQHNTNFDEIYNEFNGNIENANIKAAAAIAASKLNLSAIAQNVVHTGTFSTQGDTNLGNGADTLTINSSSGITYTPAATWTFTANQTVSGTWADLGIVTTADINGGTIDGTAIGSTTPSTADFSTLKVGSTNQGDVLYDNGTSLVRLTPGTSGQLLQTQGAAANPQWASTGLTFISATETTDVDVTTDITIETGKFYLVYFNMEVATGGNQPFIRFNNDSTGSNYSSFFNQYSMVTSPVQTLTGKDSDDEIFISPSLGGVNAIQGSFSLSTLEYTTNAGDADLWGNYVNINASGGTFMGHYDGGAVTSFEIGVIKAGGDGADSINVYLYEYAKA